MNSRRFYTTAIGTLLNFLIIYNFGAYRSNTEQSFFANPTIWILSIISFITSIFLIILVVKLNNKKRSIDHYYEHNDRLEREKYELQRQVCDQREVIKNFISSKVKNDKKNP